MTTAVPSKMASNAASKRRSSQQKIASKIIQTSPMCRLPDNIMLLIFSYLDVKSLCAGSKVCRRWYHIGKDRSLWKRVDLRPWPLTLRTLWKVVRNRFSESVVELQIKGFIGTTKKNENISLSLLEEIKTKCPNLLNLTLCYCDMRNVDARCLPPSLKFLSLHHSIIPPGWFDSLNNISILRNCEKLNLTYCTRLSDADLRSITKLTTLKELNVSNCYRLTDNAIHLIATRLTNLINLDISNCTSVSDVGLHHIGRNLSKLHTLGLASCKAITDTGIGALVHNMDDLEYLNISNCPEISDIGLAVISQNCKKLTLLDIIHNPIVSKAGLNNVKLLLPNCRIVGAILIDS